jgi:hypothetical protein
MIVKVLFLLFFYCFLVNINICFSKETKPTDNYKDIEKRSVLSNNYRDILKRRIFLNIKPSDNYKPL